MSIKWIALFYMMCALANICHIYQISDQYFRYDVTTNVKIGLPDIVEIPSMTLCLRLVDSMKWEEMSSELRNKLLLHLHALQVGACANKTFVEELIHNPSLIGPLIKRYYDAKVENAIYNFFAKEKNASEIFKLTASFEEIFRFFGTTGLAFNAYESEKLKRMEYRSPTASDFPFRVDMVFIHARQKCFTLNIRPGLNKILYDRLFSLIPDIPNFTVHERSNLISWFSSFGGRVFVYLHDQGYLITDWFETPLEILSETQRTITAETHKSYLLKYPYKTNCKDYTEFGFLSRKHCISMCFKSKSMERFNSVIEESYAFPSDNTPLKEVEAEITNQSITRFLYDQCEQKCLEKDCQLGTYLLEWHEVDKPEKTLQEMCFNGIGSTKNCSLYDFNETPLEHSACTFSVARNIVSRTETQVAIPLVQFLTEIFSTFGFWLGLSVSGSVICVKRIGAQATSVRYKIQRRQRPTKNLGSIHQQLILIRQTITMLHKRRDSDVRTRH